jgi:hypothetical protein
MGAANCDAGCKKFFSEVAICDGVPMVDLAAFRMIGGFFVWEVATELPLRHDAPVEFVERSRQPFLDDGLQGEQILLCSVIHTQEAQALDQLGQFVQGGRPFGKSLLRTLRQEKALPLNRMWIAQGLRGETGAARLQQRVLGVGSRDGHGWRSPGGLPAPKKNARGEPGRVGRREVSHAQE